MRIRTLLVAAAAFAASVLAADRIALSIAQFTDSRTVAGNEFRTSTLAAPTNLSGSVTCIVSVSRANTLTWTAATGANEYLIERAVGAGAFSTLAATSSSTYVDTAVSAGSYHYRVSSKRYQWTSAPTSAITLTQPTLCL